MRVLSELSTLVYFYIPTNPCRIHTAKVCPVGKGHYGVRGTNAKFAHSHDMTQYFIKRAHSGDPHDLNSLPKFLTD